MTASVDCTANLSNVPYRMAFPTWTFNDFSVFICYLHTAMGRLDWLLGR